MPESFTPHPDLSRDLRAALGKFATGVTVVTVNTPAGPMGMTANSFTSVSLDPPLILWCPAKASQRHDAMAGATRFALHVLGAHQQHLATGFARSFDAFDSCDWSVSAHDVPLIEGCSARFECHIRDRIDAGDHSVIIGTVERVTTSEDAPLLFLEGKFGGFRADSTDGTER